MRFPELIEGRLLRRYKRFLVDVELPGGEVVTASVANTGSMLGLAQPGMAVWLSVQENPQAKLPYRWLLVRAGRNLVCIDTSVPNRLVRVALEAGRLPQFAGYREIVPEMPLGESSRADFCLRVHADDMLARCWIEVKAVTLAQDGAGYFPDAVSSRGRRHLEELSRRAQAGERAVQLFVIQRGDCCSVRPADWIDPAYGAALRAAKAAGVEMLALSTRVTKRGIELDRPVDVEL